MGKCKNIECKNETKNKNKYCSLKCRNYYVNKYIRDYKKNAKGLNKQPQYDKNPKYCKNPNCGKKIPYSKRSNLYCNSSCQASVTNGKRIYTWGDKIGKRLKEINKAKDKIGKRLKEINKAKDKYCKECGKQIHGRRLFCGDLCRTISRTKHLTEYEKYKRECQFK